MYVRAEVAHGAREHRLICGFEGRVSSFMLVVTEEIKTWNGCVVLKSSAVSAERAPTLNFGGKTQVTCQRAYYNRHQSV